MKKIFINSENRLRSPWRILIQLVGFILLLIIWGGIQGLAVGRKDALMYGIGAGVYFLGGLGLLWGAGRWLDRRKFADFGFRLNREWWLDFGAGLLLGALMLTLVFVIDWIAGWVRVESVAQTVLGGPFILTAVSVLLEFIAIGVCEETVFRGYQVRNLAEGLPLGKRKRLAVMVALIGTSILFGMLHMGNPNATWMGGLNSALGGLLLGLAYGVTGELALPIGLHIAWNFFESFVYGFPCSGLSPAGWLIGSQVSGPELWTGGAFGPDDGLIITLLIGLNALLIVGWVKVRGRWKGIRADLAEYHQGNPYRFGPMGAATAPQPALTAMGDENRP